MIMSAVALLRGNPAPTEQQVRQALDGNLCRCGTHRRIIRAVLRAAGRRSQPPGPAGPARMTGRPGGLPPSLAANPVLAAGSTSAPTAW